MQLKDALKKLDVDNDEHWTTDGVPSVDYIRELTGEDKVTRDEIVNADPELTREALIAKRDPQPEKVDANNQEEEHQLEVKSIDEKISELDRKMNELDVEKQKLMAKRLHKTGSCINYDHRRDQQRKIDYIKKQHEIRMDKAKKRAQFLGNAAKVMKPSDFDPRAKIDQAMSRKTGRGGQRPVRPPVN